jgi:putative Mg2+ transporter-C (MgtC) family protein
MDFPSNGQLILRMLLAGLVGGVIGLEREVAGHPAGLRTHISVALGSSLFGVLSAYGFNHFDVPRNDTVFQVDVTRIASQIVVGVGFLGGGAILKEGVSVRGLTTAASLWVTAAIGLAVSLGSFIPAAATTGALMGSLVLLRRPRRWLRDRVGRTRERVLIRISSGADPSSVISALTSVEGVTLRSLRISDTDNGRLIEAQLVGDRGVDIDSALAPIGAREDVVNLDIP